ncbi:MAG: hypothetical protein U0324_14900 [Polyangiales bacterium]
MSPVVLRALGFGASAVAGVVAAWLTAQGLRARRHLTEPPPAITRDAAMRAFDEERAVARSLGMTRSAEGDASLERRSDSQGMWSLRVPVDARECVAVIAAVYGHHAPMALALQSVTDDASRIAADSSEPITVERTDGGLVLQVQWCQAEERPRSAVLETRAIASGAFPQPLTGTVHYAVFRAPWNVVGGPMRLRRGTPRAWALRQFPSAYAAEEGERAIPTGATALGVPVPLRTQSARLIPGNAATYRALYERVRGAGTEAVNPRVDASLLPGDPWESGLPSNFTELYASLKGDGPGPRLHEPMFDAGSGRRRLLAAVDVGALGAPCVALHFTRLLFLHGASLRRHEAAGEGAAGTELAAQENAVVDRRCPAEGVSLYSVAEGDQEEWLLRVFALPAPVAAGAGAGAATGAEERGRRRHRRRPR